MSDSWERSEESTEIIDATTDESHPEEHHQDLNHGDAIRVVDLADEFELRSVDALELCDRIGLGGLTAGSTLTQEQVDRFRAAIHQGAMTAPEAPVGPSLAEQSAPAGSGALYAALGGAPGGGQPGAGQPAGSPPPFGPPGAFPPAVAPPAFAPAPPSITATMNPGVRHLLFGIALIVGTIVVMVALNTLFFYPAIAGAYYLIKGLAQLISGDYS